ncbi:MAG: hypothetical protein ACFFD2_28975 [Promethearchaeota archaeon]
MKKNKSELCIIGILILSYLTLVINCCPISNSYAIDIKIQALDPSNLVNKSVGWVISHGEDDNSTYTVTVNDLKAFGAKFSQINSEITQFLLSTYDILVIEEGGTDWLNSELIALDSWIKEGGALYILGDQPGFSQGNVSLYFNVYYNTTDPLPGLLTIENPSHDIFENVTYIDAFFPSASIDETQSTSSLDVLARSGDNRTLIATLLINNGRILWNVDSDGLINDFNIGFADHRKLANNSWIWLATPNPYIPGGGGGDNMILIIIIISSIAGIAVIGTIIGIYLKKR